MGNMAVITTPDKRLGIYLHWNGGRDSVEAFLAYCEMQGYRPPSCDCYGWARMAQVIGNFFGGSLSVGIDEYERLDRDNGDNGVYIVDGWDIVGREFVRHREQSGYDLVEFLEGLDECMEPDDQLVLTHGRPWFDAKAAEQKAKRTYGGCPELAPAGQAEAG